MTLQLVVLAAGLGTRYGGGGMKQLEGVGPHGATLMEYSLFDARRAGFDDVIFIIRPDMQDAFQDFAGRFAGRMAWQTALQGLEDVPRGVTVPAGRTKPWGTAHAVLAAAPAITSSFAVLNADDFYGAEAFAALAPFLRAPAALRPASFALVGYRLEDTLSDAGPVNRAVCHIDGAGWLQDIEEAINIDRASGLEAIVSMNLWGFTPALFDLLRIGLDRFFERPDALGGEFLLPTVIRQAIAGGDCRVKVLEPGSRWFGITHQADRPGVEAELRALVAAGRYPERLWA